MPDDGGWSAEATGGPEPPPAARMLRPSWLLSGFTLEPGGPASVSGRDALRVVATPRPGIKSQRVVPRRPLDRVEVAVDAELGILLRCISFSGSQPVLRHELRDVVTGPSEPGDFRPDIPAGMRVAEEPGDEPPGPVNPFGLIAREARSAGRNLLGVIRR